MTNPTAHAEPQNPPGGRRAVTGPTTYAEVTEHVVPEHFSGELYKKFTS
jgi:hypothetical protein